MTPEYFKYVCIAQLIVLFFQIHFTRKARKQSIEYEKLEAEAKFYIRIAQEVAKKNGIELPENLK